MQKLTNRINRISESLTIGMAKKSRELIAQGVDVINLSFGEPDFDTPQHIKEAAIKAIHDGITKYPPVGGFPQLKKAISKKFEQNGLTYAPDQIIVSNGAKHSIMNAIMCLVQDGDEVLIPTPFWVSYSEMVKLSGGKPVYIKTSIESDFKISPEQLKDGLSDSTKIVLFSSPSNPTGSFYTREELQALSDVLINHPTYVISDEIYEHIRFEGEHTSIGSIPGMLEKTITVNGVSKAYAMTGWRIGYLGGPVEVVKATDKLQGQFTSGACSIAQMAALEAISGDQDPTRLMKEEFRKRRDHVLDVLQPIENIKTYTPKGAFYLFPDISSYFGMSTKHGKLIENSMDLCLYILEEGRVATVPGIAFGNDDNIRISYAASIEVLDEALNRILTALDQLK
jgi:aspartate aminotransferase